MSCMHNNACYPLPKTENHKILIFRKSSTNAFLKIHFLQFKNVHGIYHVCEVCIRCGQYVCGCMCACLCVSGCLYFLVVSMLRNNLTCVRHMIQKHTYTYTHIYTHTPQHTYIHTHQHTYTHTPPHTHMYTRIPIHTYMQHIQHIEYFTFILCVVCVAYMCVWV